MKTLPTWAEKLNELGAKHTPCFFTINYQGTQGHVFPLTDLPESVRFSFSEKTAPTEAPITIEKHLGKRRYGANQPNPCHRNITRFLRRGIPKSQS